MSQASGQLQSHRSGCARVEVLRKAYTVVIDYHGNHAVDSVDRNFDRPVAPIGKGMLETVRHQFVNQQAEGNCGLEMELNVLGIQLKSSLYSRPQ
jgi:hypothetical protein